MVAVLRLPIPTSSSRSAKELCIPCGKSGLRTRPTPGGFDTIRITQRVRQIHAGCPLLCLPAASPPPPRPPSALATSRAATGPLSRRPATAIDACLPSFAPLVCRTTPVALCYHRQRHRDSPPHLASSESGEIRGWDSSPQRPRALPNYRRNPAQHHRRAAPAVTLPTTTTSGLPPPCTAH